LRGPFILFYVPNYRRYFMEKKILRLEKQVEQIRFAILILSATFLLMIFLALAPKDNDMILRAKGLVIVDNNGNERILIGAPVPEAKNRIRTDFEKARKAWASRYPSFDWYKNLNHNTNGIIILDESGFDRIAIGDPAPDPNIGRRIAPSVGIVINDKQGFERTGWGFFPDKNRVVLGLDSDRGTEGVILSILEDGTSGIGVTGKSTELFLGEGGPNSMNTGLPGPFSGLLIRDKTGIKYILNSFNKTSQK
jgi:hypothetical protein